MDIITYLLTFRRTTEEQSRSAESPRLSGAEKRKNRISFSMNIYAINTSIFYVGKARNYNVLDAINIISLHSEVSRDSSQSW